ncbi:beta-1,3-glucanase family protein [Streptomyces goshikiensis]|uniref:beta-1,3-glucanase family protein n=1 Tax=Streptomyces goshikiensis TaxID=1942 RepID=UPI003713BA66
MSTPRPLRLPLVLPLALLAFVGLLLFSPAPLRAAAADSTPTAGGTGSFPITFRNDTRGAYTDAQIHITVLGQVTPDQWSYMKPDGTMARINHLDATAPGHLTKKGVGYPNMSFALARVGGTIPSPPSIRGGRIYVSLGSPVFLPVSPDDQGWGGPDPRNPTDPNADVYYDWYEYTYVHGQVAFGGNTTQVDQFGFPMASRLRQTSSGYDATRGISRTRAEVMRQYAASVGAAFQPLRSEFRVVAPRSSDLRKPTSPDVMARAGALASGNDTEKQLGAAFCAAFTRGVALDTTAWYTPSA